MKLLVFGANGQVGRELQRCPGVLALDRDAADLMDPDACAACIKNTSADAVINAAAFTAVDQAEEDEITASRVNGTTPGLMAEAAAARNLPFLHVSTDYVFDGSGNQPRSPTATTSPLNAYGRSKLAGEEAIRAATGRHIILRTSWVFSAHGSNFVKTMLRLAETRDTLSVVNDQVGGPTPAAEIATALTKIATSMVHTNHPGGTYHFAGTPVTSWADFAREVFRQAGKSVTVSGIPTSEYPTPAQRPLNSRLDCSSLLHDFGIAAPDWRQGLASVLRAL